MMPTYWLTIEMCVGPRFIAMPMDHHAALVLTNHIGAIERSSEIRDGVPTDILMEDI